MWDSIVYWMMLPPSVFAGLWAAWVAGKVVFYICQLVWMWKPWTRAGLAPLVKWLKEDRRGPNNWSEVRKQLLRKLYPEMKRGE